MIFSEKNVVSSCSKENLCLLDLVNEKKFDEATKNKDDGNRRFRIGPANQKKI